jgi:hypothetical protein
MTRVDRIAEQVPLTLAAASKLALASVMCLAGICVAVTKVQEPAGSAAWQSAAGWVGLALGLLTLHAALAVEGSERRPVLLLARHGAGRTAVRVEGSLAADDLATGAGRPAPVVTARRAGPEQC